MKTLVLGASGATGKHLVDQLLLKNQSLKIIVRPSAHIPDMWIDEPRITIVRANISAMSESEAAHHVKDCHAVVSCLGHVMSLKGIYGQPKNLVVYAVKLLCDAIHKNARDGAVKFVLMNTAGYRNKDANETISFRQKIAMSIIRRLLPPHLDNEKAAEFLRTDIGQKAKKVQWVVVRPDNLTHGNTVSGYEVNLSPISTLFRPNQVSRINVAHFMANLIENNDLWERWRGKMPVIYNIN